MNFTCAVEIWFLDQRLSIHLTTTYEVDASLKYELEKVDYQLVSLLWQSIEQSLVRYRSYKSCYEILK